MKDIENRLDTFHALLLLPAFLTLKPVPGRLYFKHCDFGLLVFSAHPRTYWDKSNLGRTPASGTSLVASFSDLEAGPRAAVF